LILKTQVLVTIELRLTSLLGSLREGAGHSLVPSRVVFGVGFLSKEWGMVFVKVAVLGVLLYKREQGSRRTASKGRE
jgi:hypothetical protein